VIKIFFKILLLSIYCIAFIGCGRRNANITDRPESAIVCVQNADSLESVKKCYTNNTLRVVHNLLAKKLITEDQVFSILKFTDKGDAWIDVEENINKNKAVISITFSRHSRENMRAFRLDLNAENVSGSWKLDMTDAFRTDDDESRGIKRYLSDRFKNY
jgi:hypothetical protein